jgi:NitT/TauT family transport system substrate-binding protein
MPKWDTSQPPPATSTRPWRRRRLLRAGLAGAALAATRAPLAQPALTRVLRKISIGYGVRTVDSAADGFFSSIPIGLGFFAEEGLDVDILPMAGATPVIDLMANGKIQFTTHATAGLMTAVGRGIAMQGFICQVPDYFTSIAVLKDGPIKRLEDLKGKIIGTNAVGATAVLPVRAALHKLGWNPDTDVQYLAVGTGLPALDAIRRDRVQAIVAWDSIFAQFEYFGAEFRYFRPDPIPQLGFTHASNTMVETMEKDPALVAGMCRALLKSVVVIAAAEPDELTRLHFKLYPAARPSSLSDEEVLRFDTLRLRARRQFMRLQQRVFDRTERIGDVPDESIASLRDLLAAGGEIPVPLPVERYFTRRFLAEADRLDIPALIAQARAFRA